MNKNISQIVDRLKDGFNYRTDADVTQALGMTKTALYNHKARGSIPYEALSTFCEIKNISLDWVLTGEGPMRRQDRPDVISEGVTPYGDEDEAEILRWIRENPKDKKLIASLCRGKKAARELAGGIEGGELLNEGGMG